MPSTRQIRSAYCSTHESQINSVTMVGQVHPWFIQIILYHVCFTNFEMWFIKKEENRGISNFCC